MKITKKEDGTLLVPVRVEADGVVGDTIRPINTDDKDYADYLSAYNQQERS